MPSEPSSFRKRALHFCEASPEGHMQQIEPPIERLGPVAAASIRPAAVEPWEAFIAPGDVFRHPREVLAYPGLSKAEKRAILASWASDARAVESCPALRCLPGCKAEPVPLDAV